MKAQELKTPVILGVSEGAKKYMGGWRTVVGMVDGYIRDNNITVPVALHLDHGSSFKNCKDAIDAVHSAVVTEEVAKMATLTEQINPQVKPAPDCIRDKHFYRKHGANAYYGQN